MHNQISSTNSEVITIQEIIRNVNADNLNEDIIVFDLVVGHQIKDVYPLRIDSLMIALCTEGSGKIGIDLREYDLKKNSLMVIQPKNYIYLSQYSDDFKGSVMACSKHLVQDVLPKLTDILPLLIHHRTEPVTNLTDEESEGIKTFLSFIRSKLRGPRTHFLKQKVHCMLQAALYEMMDINQKNSQHVEGTKSRKEEIMAKFILAVSEDFRTQRQVAYYAHKLFITPKHLSSVVKELSGQTAGDWIENYVIMEAKVLLNTTDMTIQEIAVALNFPNQSFFGKYFKHHTEYSPTAYRRKFS